MIFLFLTLGKATKVLVPDTVSGKLKYFATSKLQHRNLSLYS